jgi:hypothetical protein
MSDKTLPELRARRDELLRQSWEMVCTPPSGEQAGYAFDEAHDEVEREIADIEREIAQRHADTHRDEQIIEIDENGKVTGDTSGVVRDPDGSFE